jgi:hypothetical protein
MAFMRTLTLILLSTLIVLSPAAQAQACDCGEKVSRDTTPACCCTGGAHDSEKCCCQGCGTDADRDAPGMANCVCNQTQPQATPDAPDQVVFAEPHLRGEAATPADIRPVFEPAPTTRRELKPSSFRPLLV